MAKNWSMRQAAEAVIAGNKEDIIDIGRRFPLTLNALSSMNGNKGAMDIISALPEHITARKIESGLKDGVIESEDDDDEITEPKEIKTKKVVEEEDVEEVEKPKRGRKKKEDDPYANMSEVNLFKLCKSKGIKAKPKMTKNYYINLLNCQLETPDVDEDNEEEEVEEKKPAKKEKAVAKKAPINKPKALKEDDNDEDDDWDI